jgi:hypothetical protein
VYNPGDVFEAKCPTDISKFPFDEQQCSFTFIAWAIPKQFLRLSSLKDQASFIPVMSNLNVDRNSLMMLDL